MGRFEPKTLLFCLVTSLVIALGSSAVSGQESPSGQIVRGRPLAEALRGGGYVVYFRHAATNADQVDTDKPDFARCETQRNLSDDGRRVARDIGVAVKALGIRDRKSTRLNSSHSQISYAVFCLKKKK